MTRTTTSVRGSTGPMAVAAITWALALATGQAAAAGPAGPIAAAAPAEAAAPDDDAPVLYTLGQLIARTLDGFALTPEELAVRSAASPAPSACRRVR